MTNLNFLHTHTHIHINLLMHKPMKSFEVFNFMSVSSKTRESKSQSHIRYSLIKVLGNTGSMRVRE